MEKAQPGLPGLELVELHLVLGALRGPAVRETGLGAEK